MEPLTQRMLPPRRAGPARREWLAAVLAALVCTPLGGAPDRAAAAVLSAPAPAVASTVESAASNPAGAATPSIQYEQAMEHQGDQITFDPGGPVTVPFSPRAGDDLQVDGKPPRALPAGHATGLQMRANPGSDTAPAGPPADLAGPRYAGTPKTAALVSYVTSGTGDTAPSAPISPGGLRREVFGFLPYWEVGDSKTTIDYGTLSTIAYFSVGCLSSGALDKFDADGTTTAGWGGWTSSRMTSIINAAHTNQTRVVLTISCFAWGRSGAIRQARLLGSATARSRLAKAAAAAVRDRGADGINLDFEPIVPGYADEFTALVRSIRSELNKVAPGYQLTFDTFGAIGNYPIVDATAPGGADAVFVMAYDYRTGSSSNAGSISPLTGPRYDLNDTVNAYTAKISPSKVILGVPYYGRAWSTSSDALNAPNISGTKYGGVADPTYSQVADLVAKYGRRWDSIEQAPWTAYRKETCTGTYGCVTAWRELYYDDAASLRLRYDLVNRASLRGAGIWALGYDGARPELRQAIIDKFRGVDRTPPVVGVATLAQTQRDAGFRVAWSSWDDSAIAGYDVQVSVDRRPWAAWLTGTTLTSSIYLGSDGRTYAFRIRATDVRGNTSRWYAAASAKNVDPPGGITVGGFASVLTDGLRMRTSASTGAPVMTTLAAGDALWVTGGPVVAQGSTWFQVTGPVRQWAAVDTTQVGGWVVASGNGKINVGPRRPVYATRVAAGIADMQLNGGGVRVVTPNGDGDHDTLHLTWTNHRTFDRLALRVFRIDGTFVGSVGIGGTSSGSHAYDWNGRIKGVKVPAGAYVLQLQGVDGGATYSAPSASPVNAPQILLTGVIVGDSPVAVRSFTPPASSTNATRLVWTLTFGGPITGLSASDIVRAGTATGCVVGAPVGDGTTFTITLTRCSAGTVTLGLKPGTVSDAVTNWGPAARVNAPTLLIDRSAPTAATPKVTLLAGVDLASTSITQDLRGSLNLAGKDPGGAGIRSYDIKRSIDGGAFALFGTDIAVPTFGLSLTPGHSYRFQVRARDNAGNVGAWVVGPVIRPYLPQEASAGISWGGTWTDGAGTGYSGASDRFATTAGASATYAFTGRSIAWVTTLAADHGAARIYLDGVLVATVDTYAATASFRRVAFARTWSSSGFHTLRIVVVGTLGRPRVDVDALEVLR